MLKNKPIGLTYFDIEVNNGITWVSLNDHIRYIAGAGSLSDDSHSLRNITAASSMYDGTWVIHSSDENVAETLEIQVLGSNYSELEENAADLIGWFKQLGYYVRVSLDNHVETWRCFPADYSRTRGHVHAHNTLQIIRLSVPRLPAVTREVRE
jgi:hypothetical protein